MFTRQRIALDVGWPLIEEGFLKVVRIVDHGAKDDFTSDDYMSLYSTIYMMSNETGGNKFVYEGYKSLLEGYLQTQVLPSLLQKHGSYLLVGLVQRWSNYLGLVRRLKFFCYIDWHYTCNNQVPDLKDTARECFRDVVYAAVESRAEHAFLSLVNGEHFGEKIDHALLSNSLDFFLSMRPRDRDFAKKLESLRNVDELSDVLASSMITAE